MLHIMELVVSESRCEHSLGEAVLHCNCAVPAQQVHAVARASLAFALGNAALLLCPAQTFQEAYYGLESFTKLLDTSIRRGRWKCKRSKIIP